MRQRRRLVTRSVFLLGLQLLAFAASCLASSQAGAEETPDVRTEARERFNRGLALFDEGDNAGALAEFKKTYLLVPNRLVLYNIGIVYAAMNRPVEATDTLEKVLSDPGPLSANNIEIAKRTRDEQSKRVAQLVVATNVPAIIEINGVEAGRSTSPGLLTTVRVSSGTHLVGALAAGHMPLRKEVTLAGGSRESVSFELEPSEVTLAHVFVRSPVPGAEVFVDDQRVGVTPLLSSLTVKPGKRVVELRRPGYATARREITLGDGASAELAMPLLLDREAGAEQGTLSLDISEPDASIRVDGVDLGVYRAPIKLPLGPHTLLVERGGFEVTNRVVEVKSLTVVKVSLAPTAQTRSARAERVRAVRTLGWSTLVAGGVVALAGGTLAVVAHARHGDAQDTLKATQLTFLPGAVCDPKGAGNHTLCISEFNKQSQEVDTQATRRTVGLAAAGVGVAGAVAGAILLWRNPLARDTGPSFSWAPRIEVTPSFAGLRAEGRF
ncbi:MAG: PEGA domain-containing protein [Deltaproteobacteria bacterium]|nr:PEGA domain-containing protein [Deltaproteobacteria bacterium]